MTFNLTLIFAARCYAQARPMPSCGVCPSGCLSSSCILSKRINVSSKLFHRRVATPFYFSSYQTLWQYSDGDPPNGTSNEGGVGKNLDYYLSLGSMTAGPSGVVNISTVELSYRSKWVPSGPGDYLRLLVGELETPKLSHIFAYGKWLYPYRMQLHGASDLDQRSLKTRSSKD